MSALKFLLCNLHVNTVCTLSLFFFFFPYPFWQCVFSPNLLFSCLCLHLSPGSNLDIFAADEQLSWVGQQF